MTDSTGDPSAHGGTSGSGSRKRLLQTVLQRLRPLRGFPVWARYGIATILVVVSAVLRGTLVSDVNALPYILFFPAIILASFAFDRGSGFSATIVAAALSTARDDPGAPLVTIGSGVGLGIFIFTGLFCAAVIEALRLTVDELAEREDDLERDIAVRKRTEAALAESEARFRATFENAAAGVALVGLDGSWLRVNRRLWETLGYSEAELLGMTFQDITHPDDLDADLSYLGQLLAGEIPAYSMEKRYIRKDGSPIWILLTVALVRDLAGAPRTFISVIQDISFRKEAERLLARDRAELERLVEERTAALMRAAEDRRRAEDALRQGEKLQAIGQLTGGIAHDFNNFLQVVGAGAQLLSSQRITDDRRTTVLDSITKATRNAADLTSRLLAFARRQALRPETFDLNARLQDMTGLLRHTLSPKIDLVLDLTPEVWPVRVDPQQLEVALVNLAVNARDAMAETGGTLRLATRNGVAAAGSNDGPVGHVDLIVSDDGEGIAPAVLSRVFEPFFTTKELTKGTGLGLAQVHGFIKQSGGEVFLDSAPGEGTVVTLRLPRALDGLGGPSHPAPHIEQMMSRASGQCVLVVDDNADVAAFAAAMLGDLGYVTRQASNAAEALTLLEATPGIDAVFSDVVMPGRMNGIELAQAVRARYPRIAVVLASGYSDSLANWEGPRIWEVLNKPYRLDELGAALERALRGKPRVSDSAG